MASLQRACAAVRQRVLANVRLPPNVSLPSAAVAPISLHFLRLFAEASYLDKNEVADRVLNVVKNFDKVDAGKVRFHHWHRVQLISHEHPLLMLVVPCTARCNGVRPFLMGSFGMTDHFH